MRRIASVVAMLIILAACGQDPVQNEPAKQAAPATGEPTALQPGQYRVVMKVNRVEFPGMTGVAAEKAKAMFGTVAQTSEYCLTPEDAAKGRKEHFRRTLAKGDCQYDKLNLTNGSIDGELVCQTGQGMTARNKISGTFNAVRSDIAVDSLSQVPGGQIRMAIETSAERIGECN